MLAARGISIRALPEHVDGAAGLEPLGRFYFRQAILLAIPAAFLLAWSILLTLPELEARYGDWRAWYLAGLGVAVLLELTAFVAPLVGVHHAIRRGKQDALATVDKELAPLIATLRERLEQELDGDTRAAVSERLDRLLERVRALEEMRTLEFPRIAGHGWACGI
jgi:hypothetical protein